MIIMKRDANTGGISNRIARMRLASYEVYPRPSQAMSDGRQRLGYEVFLKLTNDALHRAEVVGRFI